MSKNFFIIIYNDDETVERIEYIRSDLIFDRLQQYITDKLNFSVFEGKCVLDLP